MAHLGDAPCGTTGAHCILQWTPTQKEATPMERYGLSLMELEAQHVELLPDRIEMRRRRRRRIRRSGFGQDCDAAIVNAGTGLGTVVTPVAPVLSGNATCVGIQQ